MENNSCILAVRIPWTAKKAKRYDTRRWLPPRLEGVQYATGEEWRAITNSYWKEEAVGPKQKWQSVVDVSHDKNEPQCCKEQYYIGTWIGRPMNQGKLNVVKQEMARVNINILRISELTWTGMGKFNSEYHYIYYCAQESHRKKWSSLHSQQSPKCSMWVQSLKWQNDLSVSKTNHSISQ